MTDQLQKMSGEDLLDELERLVGGIDHAYGEELDHATEEIPAYRAELLRRLEAGARLAVAAERLDIPYLIQAVGWMEDGPALTTKFQHQSDALEAVKAALADYRKAAG